MTGEGIHGATVAVIGGGPGGSAAAIRLAQLSRLRGLGVRVVLFEGKDFERHYNQCAGVLSPPIEELLGGRLGIELPYDIFKRQIYGYRLHAGGRVPIRRRLHPRKRYDVDLGDRLNRTHGRVGGRQAGPQELPQ